MTSKEHKSNKSDKASALYEEIDKAMKSATVTKFRTEQLHENWRTHLLRLSIGVILLSLYQYSEPVRECILEIKSSSEVANVEVSPSTAMKLIFSESLVELVNVVIAAMLCLFLTIEDFGNFSSRPYVIAASFVPFCIGLFFNTERNGCVIQDDGSIQLDGGASSNMSERQFPVSVIFHLIVTGCCWFIKMGMDQVNMNLAAVERLHSELVHLNKKSKKNK